MRVGRTRELVAARRRRRSACCRKDARIVRGGFGKFVQRTPLNVGAFPSFEPRTISRFDADGSPLGGPVTLANRIDGRSPHARGARRQRRMGSAVRPPGPARRWRFSRRSGSHEYIVSPDPAAGELRLSSTGTSRYRELEATARYLGGERRDLTLSYVWARGTADLNNYDQFYGNFRNPIVRANEHNLISTDVRHRLLLRGTIGLPGKWDFAPVLELRSGFPWSAVNEFQDFVGPRNRAGRLPAVRTLDFSIARPWRVQEVPLPRRHQGLQPVRRRGRSRHPDQHHVAVLRHRLQPGRAIDRLRLRIGEVEQREHSRLASTAPSEHRQAAGDRSAVGIVGGRVDERSLAGLGVLPGHRRRASAIEVDGVSHAVVALQELRDLAKAHAVAAAPHVNREQGQHAAIFQTTQRPCAPWRCRSTTCRWSSTTDRPVSGCRRDARRRCRREA